MSRTFGCWLTLSEDEKLSCFEAKSAPRRGLQYQTQKLSAWRVAGKLQEEWNRIAPEIKSRTDNINFRSSISPGNPENALIRWELYLVGKTPEASKLKPTIVAECGDVVLAKKACKALQDMKKHSLEPLLGTYDMHYAQAQIRLRAEPNGIVSPSLSSADGHYSLCGQQIIISSCLGAETPIFTTSTIGGAILIGGTYYALTAAHAFPERIFDRPTSNEGAQIGKNPPHPGDESLKNDATVSDSAPTPRGLLRLTRSVYIQKCDRNSINPEDLSIPAQPSTGAAALINSASQHVMLNRNQDWALVPIENYRFMCENKFTSPTGSILHVTGISENIPPGPVIIATGVSDPAVSTVSQTTSLLLLPGCEQLQIVWSAEKPSAPGDCGSWVIDGNGKVCAMVVAASEDDDEIYCLPLAPIFRNIQEQIGSEGQPEMPLDDELLAKNDKDSSVDGLHKGQSLTVIGWRSLLSGDSKSTMNGYTPIRQERSTNVDVLIEPEFSQSKTGPRHAEPERDIQSTIPGMQKEEAVSVTTTSAAQNETEKSIKVGEPSAGHDSQMEKQNTRLSSNRDSESRSLSGPGINQKSQDKLATATTLSFQSPELESRSPPSRERERETFVREEIRERPRSPPAILREEHIVTSADPVVLARRAQENFKFVPRPRSRSPSPEPERKVGGDDTIIREEPKIISRPPSRTSESEQDENGERIIFRRHKRINDRRPPRPPRPRERDVQPPPPREVNSSRDIRRDKDDRGDVENYKLRLKARFLQLGESRDAVACRNNNIAGYSPGQIQSLLEVESDNTQSATERPKATHQTNTFSSNRPGPQPATRQTPHQLADRPFHHPDHMDIPKPSYRPSDLHNSRHPFSSLDRFKKVSRKDISPQSLEEFGIQWHWDPHDDYYIRMALVSDSQMQRLREHTQRTFNGDSANKIRSRPPLSGPADTYVYAPWRRYVDDLDIDRYDDRRQYRESFHETEYPERRRSISRVHTTFPRRQRSQDQHEREMAFARRLREHEPGIAIRAVEERYRKQVEQQKSIDSNCRVLDLEFEAMVQDLFWDAGISPETCDTLIKMHQDKEAKIRAHSHGGAHHNHSADHCSNCNGSTSATPGGKGEEDDKNRERLTCSMKVEIDGVIMPCAKTFREDDALRRHEQNHLSQAPYYVEESGEVKRPLQRQDSPRTGYTDIKRYVERVEDPDTRYMQRVREYS
ncbi:hypothetical protein EPUS_09149 [Endocarpon pusillum Z07020]|uniref:C2H2-type domain-containing protein n=1 Tax=Endocarpon pusillum (strain Z07020 / HMAS-L-300199) TaxID=1263415 RepID=U1GH78_ENDPU|nr:uncharacterized protein EPUS_09149 [Endocarpon pusillum Z07020]ERF71126.1 hypothetical protein EPUS_09149 [Endocarpon pusillum Z07020]